MVNKQLRFVKKETNVKFKNWKKNKITTHDLWRFESILVPEDNGKQHPNKPDNNKYQKHVACSYDYK